MAFGLLKHERITNNSEVIMYSAWNTSYGTTEDTSELYGKFIDKYGKIHRYSIPGIETYEGHYEVRYDKEKIDKDILKKYDLGIIGEMNKEDLERLKSCISNYKEEYYYDEYMSLDAPMWETFIINNNEKKLLTSYYKKNVSLSGNTIIEILNKYNVDVSEQKY